MGYQRIDAQMVMDEFGNTMWMPDLGSPSMMEDRVPAAGSPGPNDAPYPFSGQNMGGPIQGGPFPPPNPLDPTTALQSPLARPAANTLTPLAGGAVQGAADAGTPNGPPP